MAQRLGRKRFRDARSSYIPGIGMGGRDSWDDLTGSTEGIGGVG